MVGWDGPGGGPFAEVTSTDPNNPGIGNYVVFEGVTGDEFTVTGSAIANGQTDVVGAAINGIQIVVPEPGTLVLLLAGLLLVPLLRRRH